MASMALAATHHIIAALSACLGFIIGGVFSFKEVSTKAGKVKPAPRRLRNRRTGTPTLLLFVHPRCPSTLATVRQLRNLLTANQFELRVQLIVFCPPGCDESWYQTEMVLEAQLIADLEIVLDERGGLARKYGAMTSGTTVMYDHRNLLVFQGGLTPAHGREGDCLGVQTIQRILSGNKTTVRRSDVFGCELFST